MVSGEKQQVIELVVEESDSGARCDVFLAKSLKDASRSQLRKAFDQQSVLLNGEPTKPRTIVKEGDSLRLEFVAPVPATLDPIPMDLDILFEDDHLIVINKPSGLSVHPGAGPFEPTLVHGLLAHCQSLDGGEDPDRPGIVHRLDKQTSGVLVCAKTKSAHRGLAEQFKAKTNKRLYSALLDGAMISQTSTVETWLRRDPKNRLRYSNVNRRDYEAMLLSSNSIEKQCKFARSHFKRLATYGARLTMAEVELETGRTHQIRLHAQEMSTPVIGDKLYGRSLQLPQTFPEVMNERLNRVGRQMLHAKTLGFKHPVSGDYLEYSADLPADFSEIMVLLTPHEDRL